MLSSTLLMSGIVKHLGNLDSKMMRYEKIILFNDVSIIFIVFVAAFLHKKTGEKGPDLAKLLEVPEIIQKILKSIRNH